HAVVGVAGADPLVHGAALLLSDVAVVRGVVKRRQGSSIDLQASGVRSLDDLLVACNDVPGRRGWIFARVSDVVDAFHEHDMRDPRVRQHVVLETRERVDPRLKSPFAEHAVTGNAGVHHPNPQRVRLHQHTPDQLTKRIRVATVDLGNRCVGAPIRRNMCLDEEVLKCEFCDCPFWAAFLAAQTVSGQSSAPAAGNRSSGVNKSATLRTPWGAPDLQGTWDFRTVTPMERPPELAGKATLTEKEAAEYER